MLLRRLSQATAACSGRKHVRPRLGSIFLSTTLADGTAPSHLRRSLSHDHSSSSLWQQQGAGGLRPRYGAWSPAGWTASSSGPQGVLAHSSELSRRTFQHNDWSLEREWIGSSVRKDVAWLRPRKDTLRGGFGRSRARHFGGGGYVDPQLALEALIATNVGVFMLWNGLGGHFMRSNFVASGQALKEGRLHTLVTSAFSQYKLDHLLTNMIGLYCFGSEIGELFGGQRLILLYLAGGIAGSLAHVAYWAYVMPWVEGYPRRFSRDSPGVLGASGAVTAIILLNILLFPTRIIYLKFIIPVPAAVVGIIIIGSDLWAARDGRRNVKSAAAHLGGAVVGALAWLRWQ